MYLIISWFYSLRKFQEKTEKLKNRKTEKLFFMENLSLDLSGKKQFFSFSVLLTELFRNISRDKTEKLKNCFFHGESLPGSLWKKQFFSFAYGTLPEHFRRQNWKTEKLFFMENLSLDLSGKNSFSVFQFCLRNSSGTFPETKLKNWKTVFYGESLPGSLWKKQFFSFSVLLTEVFRNIPHFLVVQCMSYIFIYELDMWPPKRSLPNQEVKMCLKHCKNQCFFEKCCFFWGGATIYIYIYIYVWYTYIIFDLYVCVYIWYIYIYLIYLYIYIFIYLIYLYIWYIYIYIYISYIFDTFLDMWYVYLFIHMYTTCSKDILC